MIVDPKLMTEKTLDRMTTGVVYEKIDKILSDILKISVNPRFHVDQERFIRTAASFESSSSLVSSDAKKAVGILRYIYDQNLFPLFNRKFNESDNSWSSLALRVSRY